MTNTYTVQIFFRGLCGIVPEAPLYEPQSWLGVMLVNGSESRRSAVRTLMGAGDFRLAPHYPFLVYNSQDLQGLGQPTPNAQTYRRLDREDVFLLPEASSGYPISSNYNSPAGEEPDPQKPKEAGDIKWIASLDDVVSGAGIINDDCLRDNPQTDLLAGRVHLTEGYLQTDRLGRFRGENVVLQFDPQDPTLPDPVRQVLARSFMVEIYGVTGSLTVRTYKFGESAYSDLVFRQPASGLLTLGILDLCPGDLVEDPGRDAGLPEPDYDFGWYYTLSDLFKDTLPNNFTIPIPVKFSLKGGGGGLEPARCTSAQFSPIGTAAARNVMGLVGRKVNG